MIETVFFRIPYTNSPLKIILHHMNDSKKATDFSRLKQVIISHTSHAEMLKLS